MRLYALSDLHVGHKDNHAAIAALPADRDAWLILGGDLGETPDQIAWVFETLGPRYAQLVWVPGNHELWTVPHDACQLRGEARYLHLVELCRRFGVLSPEDDYAAFPGAGGPYRIAPLFLGYDYSFRPDDVPAHDALAWARQEGLVCADEHYLHYEPFASRQAWCAARVAEAEARLAAVDDARLVVVNHFPLHPSLAFTPRIPRFSIWCGTRLTETWHTRFPIEVVVSGHLHMPSTRWLDGVRFEEVSLGYPKERRPGRAAVDYRREILPGAHAEPGRDRSWR